MFSFQLAQIPEGHQTSHISLKNGSKNSGMFTTTHNY